MIKFISNLLLTSIIFIICSGILNTAKAEIKTLRYSCFVVKHEIILPGSPVIIYDAITGDISGWWDHSFSDTPLNFYIEPKPGGGFYEIFDENGDGVLHATVIIADRGKLLRFDGPLGLSGRAIKMVHTIEFSPIGSDSTILKISVNVSGESDEGLPETLNRVWYHFLFERLKPYIEKKRHFLHPFEENQIWGYRNTNGHVIIKPAYHVVFPFNQYGIAAVADDSGWVYINMNGKYILKPYIVDNGPDNFSEGLARYVDNNRIGFMNESGAKIITATFDFVLPFSDGLAAFCVGCKQVSQDEYHRIEGGKWGYINKTGEIAVDPEYDKADSFQNGMAEVIKGEKKFILKRDELEE
jgi:hypothetical protein